MDNIFFGPAKVIGAGLSTIGLAGANKVNKIYLSKLAILDYTIHKVDSITENMLEEVLEKRLEKILEEILESKLKR